MGLITHGDIGVCDKYLNVKQATDLAHQWPANIANPFFRGTQRTLGDLLSLKEYDKAKGVSIRN